MANKRIEQLPGVASLLGHEQFPVSDGGSSAIKADIDDVGEFLDDRFDYGCRLKTTSDQNITSATWTKITWHTDSGTQCWDHGGWWSTGTDLTGPTGVSGLYLIGVVLGLDTGGASAGNVLMRVQNDNEATPIQCQKVLRFDAATSAHYACMFTALRIDASDTVYAQIYQESLGSSFDVLSGSALSLAMVGRI